MIAFFQFILALLTSLFGSTGLGKILAQAFGLPLCLALFVMSGCSADYWLGAYKPTTEFDASYGPAHAHYRSDRDDDWEITECEYDPSTKRFTLKAHIKQNASDVVKATGDRALQVAQGQLTQIAYVQAVGTTVSQIIQSAGQAAPPILKAYFDHLNAIQTSQTALTLPNGTKVDIGKTSTPVQPPASQPAAFGPSQ